MANESMTLAELSSYLRRDRRELERMAGRGQLPGRRASGEWRFEKSDMLHWLETRLHTLSKSELADLENAPVTDHPDRDRELAVTPLLSAKTTAVPLPAKTKASVLRTLVELAAKSGELYQAEVVLDAVLAREHLLSTGLDCGVALPHWRRPLAKTIGDNIICYGRTASPVPFGAASGGLTDIFFLILCRNDHTHLHVLARLSRLLQHRGFLDELRNAQAPVATLAVIEAAERELVEAGTNKHPRKRELLKTK